MQMTRRYALFAGRYPCRAMLLTKCFVQSDQLHGLQAGWGQCAREVPTVLPSFDVSLLPEG